MQTPARSPSDEFYAKMTAAAVVFAIVFEGAYFFSVTPPFDPLGYLIGRDFVGTWMSAKSVLEGQSAAWFDFDTLNAALQSSFGPDFPLHHLTYPPHLLLFVWPLGFLPYLVAYAIWCIAGFALYMIAAAWGERRTDRLVMLAISPAVLVNVFAGQNGFFTAALLIGGLRLLERRPIVAGILFGVLTIKPHLGVLLPLMLVMTGQWRAIAAAAVTTVALLATATAMFGTDIWVAYFEHSLPKQREILEYASGILPPMMPTAFMNVRVAGLPLSFAWALQAMVSAAAVAAVIWTYWRRRDPVLSTALLVTATFLVTPYIFNYDMVVFGWVLLQLRAHEGTRIFDDRLAMVVWTLPLTTTLLGLAHIPISFLALAAFAARLVWRMKHAETEAVGHPRLAQGTA